MPEDACAGAWAGRNMSASARSEFILILIATGLVAATCPESEKETKPQAELSLRRDQGRDRLFHSRHAADGLRFGHRAAAGAPRLCTLLSVSDAHCSQGRGSARS